MTFKELSKRIATCYNSLPALIDALNEGFVGVDSNITSLDGRLETVEDRLDGMMITTTTSGSTTASGNIVANAPTGNVFPISSKLTSPTDGYIIPYWLTGDNAWAFRVKQNDDTSLASASITIETIWYKV